MSDEAGKLSQHLALLRAEYVKLQQRLAALERENAMLAATAGKPEKGSFVSKLLDTVSSLYNQPLYSDLSIVLPSTTIHGHKFVLSARSDSWRVPSLSSVESLDWTDLAEDVASSLLGWVYKDIVTFNKGDQFTMDLMAAASQFKLGPLVDRCEQTLMASVSVSNCVRFYATADEINALQLKEHCSHLISTNWDSFSYQDFVSLSAQLVYDMLKAKAKYCLHTAIRLKREDVVFLYLIEFNTSLGQRINEPDHDGYLPLDLALETKQVGIASSLVDHQVNVNQTSDGNSLLHLAILRADNDSCHFLLDHGAQVNMQTALGGETPLHLLAQATEANMMSDVVTRVAEKADVNLQNLEGESPLHVAIKAKNINVFDILLSQGANLEHKTSEGKPPLWFALQDETKFEEDSLAGKLITGGADPSCVCSPGGDTLLHSLATQGAEEAGLYLVSVGANVDRVNRRGETALHLASQRGLATLTTAMLVAGADPNLQTISGDVFRQTALHLALAAGQETVVACLLEFSQDQGLGIPLLNINAKNSADETCLALALSSNMNNMALQLIESGADVNVTDGSGLTLLHKALEDGNIQSGLFLLQNGADINLRTPNGLTPLELSVRASLEPIVERLCQAGADSTSSSSGEPPLWIALDAGAMDVASILVRHGVDTDAWGEGPDQCQQTLLHRAIDENNEEIACFLIRSGCDLDTPRKSGPGGEGGDEARDGQTPLHLTSQWGLDGALTCLIEHGADLNCQDAEKKTPLHHAIENGHHGIINLLLGCPGINLAIRDKAGLSPFAAAMTFKNNSAAKTILELEPGAAEHPDSRGKNFLHTAIIKGDLESLLFLISINVNVHSKTTDSNKLAPLLLAIQVGNEMMTRNLLLAGASVQERTLSGQTALHLAAESDNFAIASVLLSNGIDFSAVDERGNNALHVAVKEGHVATARILLTESRVDAESFNNKGRNPLHVLARFGGENATAMFDLFIECMPEYPIDKPDEEGNSPLLLAYIKGNGGLCRALVTRGAILGTFNKSQVNIFNHEVATKQLLYRLLDLLSAEPRWGEGDCCEECQNKFGITTRKHHCRHCGRLLCGKCSAKEMPIVKYNLTKPVRVCNVCADLLTLGPAAGL